MKLICSYAGCCFPDYWGGHHLAHIQVLVDKATTARGLKREMSREIREGAWSGSDERTQYEHPESEAFEEAALKAVEELEILSEHPFGYLEDDSDCCYAYFVFEEITE